MEGTSILPYTLSDSNLMKAVKLRAAISEDIVRPTSAKPFIHHLNKLHEYTLHLCSTRGYQRRFRRMVEQALFDEEIYKTLQEARVLNWCREVRKQFPLKVPGEGNSLLHSISLYMWGVQDTDLVLQKTFHEALVKAHDANFKLRFQTEYRTDQGFLDPALLHQPKIWDQEWQNVIESSNPGSPAGHPLANIYQDVHIFVLANIVRRPIVVVVGNSKGSSKSVSERMTSSPAGIYLPLHWPPHLCYSYPILLSYAHQYFTPLISVNDVGPANNSWIGASHSDEIFINVPEGWVRLYINPLPDDLNLVQDYFQLVNHQYKFWQQNTDKERSGRNEDGLAFLSNLSIVGDKCLTPGCTYFCSKFTKPFCHTCCDAFRKTDVSSGANNCQQSDGQGDNVKELETKEIRDSLSKSRSRTKQTPSGSQQAAMAKIGNYGPLVPQGQRQTFSQLGESAKCKNQNCQYFGTEEQNGFCTMCFFRYVEEIGASAQQDPNQHVNHSPTAPNGNLAQISSHLKNMSVCSKADCSMLANPVYSGYCEKCYVYAQSKHAQRIKAGRDIPADQHIWSPVLPRCHNYNASNDQGLSDRTTNELFEVELVTSSNSSSGHLQSSQIRTFSSSDQQNLETRRKLCSTQDCENFGNAKCDGYCNACFTTLQMHRK
ncbi:hypothetical protein chiPu_0020822 [Chiloscyllium punctatum]|uniref:ubiquitinyl hydrolase 1 n=1 Tax=Chiloscyllium punctatum TaxID=137246 RepID=A0A401RK46_CHIPU|nr:hypothetical protein [Chiloscyllium punctatum]